MQRTADTDSGESEPDAPAPPVIRNSNERIAHWSLPPKHNIGTNPPYITSNQKKTKTRKHSGNDTFSHKVFFANVSYLSAVTKTFLANLTDTHIIGILETHMRGDKAIKAKTDLEIAG